ncbi:uncharacterized protein LOC135432961 [Drosophila montana]|uniref:uncharacterized protein LOC135432961 n=1 Tax=Drosophila montana TaxID=40370 RepID=UPI00313CDC72
MLYPPAFNLFLYNALLCHMIKYVDRCIDGHKGQASLWHYVPIIGDYLVPKETNFDPSMEYNEFPKALLNLNYLINALALLPGLVQHRWLAFLVALIVIWNLFVFERVLAFQLTLMWSLWLKDISSLTYAVIISFIAFMNTFHLILIVDSIKMQHGCLRTTVPIANEEEVAADVPPHDGRGDGHSP